MSITKRIFISDLHLGTERSVQTQHPYGWLNKNADLLAKFLEQLIERTDVKELVILGDMLDDWVIPADLDPDPTDYRSAFDAICKADQNQSIVKHLKQLASPQSGIRVSYVPGNHDMALTRRFLEETFPGIHWIGDENPDTQVYHSGIIYAEHGHRFCLFNAPNDLTEDPNHLPLGYYISRCAAQEEMCKGENKNVVGTVADFIKGLRDEKKDIPAAVLDTVAKGAGMDGDSPVQMPNGAPPLSIDQVKQRFTDLMPRWNTQEQQGKRVCDAKQALLADAGYLESVVRQVYGKDADAKNPRIVICGHTHFYGLWGKSGDGRLRPGGNTQLPGHAHHFLYANSGTWVDSTSLSTYVETEERSDQKRHYVRVKKFTSDGTSVEMLSAYIPLGD